jgi:antitoxin component YwqK of YwqJK toxin-antitoxin module
MRIVLLLLLLLTVSAGSAQQDRRRIARAFDRLTFYNDTTVKEAYRTKWGKKHGYAVEFSEDGKPTAIGRYSRGEKWWWWIYPDNSTYYYYNGYKAGENMQPDCATGQPHDFNILYDRLLNREKYP